jgi:hypothetical protein
MDTTCGKCKTVIDYTAEQLALLSPNTFVLSTCCEAPLYNLNRG